MWCQGSLAGGRTAEAMKLAASSLTLDRLLTTLALTQLEWIEQSAAHLALDGIVYELAHFPRTDSDYLAQCKKVTVDLGLTPVAVHDETFLALARTDAQRAETLRIAVALGVPLILCSVGDPGEVPPADFNATVKLAKTAASQAKAVNVTLACLPRVGSIASDLAALRHLVKDVDSAWLRYAVPAAEIASDTLGGRDRIVLALAGEADAETVAASPFLGWTIVEAPEGDSSDAWAPLAAAVRALRVAGAKKTLALQQTSF